MNCQRLSARASREDHQLVDRLHVLLLYFVVDGPFHGVEVYSQRGLVIGWELDDWCSKKRI